MNTEKLNYHACNEVIKHVTKSPRVNCTRIIETAALDADGARRAASGARGRVMPPPADAATGRMVGSAARCDGRRNDSPVAEPRNAADGAC